jgi:hypothetical protein
MSLFLRTLISEALMLLYLAGVAQAADVTWTIVIAPAASGKVLAVTDKPAATKTLAKSGQIAFAKGALVDLTFTPNQNYKLESVYKNLENWTNALDVNKHARFGPVEKNHLIVAKFAIINPQGDFGLQYPDDPPEGVAPVYDATGHYEGKIPFTETPGNPLTKPRAFNVDVAMDETGKLDVQVNSVDGLVSDPANQPLTAKLTTFEGSPRISATTHGKGTLDGTALSASASGTVTDLKLTPTAPGLTAQAEQQNVTVEGLRKYRATVAFGELKPITVVKKDGPFTMPDTSAEVSREWGITVNLQERLDAKNRRKLYAGALLTLPNQRQLQFAERPVKYSAKNGFTLKLIKGVRDDLSIDKRTRVTVKNMQFSCSADGSCDVSGGTLSYAFLGQKGKGEIADFLVSQP